MSLAVSAVSSIAGITNVVTSVVTVNSSASQNSKSAVNATPSSAPSYEEFTASSSPANSAPSNSPSPSVVTSSVAPSIAPPAVSSAAGSSSPSASESPSPLLSADTGFTVLVTSVTTLTDLPLTTVFTPPASCSTRPFTLTASGNKTVGIWDVQYNTTHECYPPSWNIAKANYYLPGVCPSGYGYVGIYSYQTTTSANCCPSGMSLVDSKCQTIISTPTIALMPDLTNTMAISNTTFTGFATPVNVAWRSADLQKFIPSAAPVLAIASNWNLPTPTRDATVETTSTAPEARRLSSGAKAGIGIGVSVGVLLLLGMAFLLFRRKRQQENNAALSNPDMIEAKGNVGNDTSSTATSPSTSLANELRQGHIMEIDGHLVNEVSGNPIVEMSGGGDAVEMPVSRPCPELAGSSRPHELEAPYRSKFYELP